MSQKNSGLINHYLTIYLNPKQYNMCVYSCANKTKFKILVMLGLATIMDKCWSREVPTSSGGASSQIYNQNILSLQTKSQYYSRCEILLKLTFF